MPFNKPTRGRPKPVGRSSSRASRWPRPRQEAHSDDIHGFLAVLNHPEAGVSTNVFLRILHNRAVDLAWIVQPVILKKAWPKIRYGRRRGITFEEHQKILAVTPREDYRLFFELLWETGGSQTDIASLTADDIDWRNRRLYLRTAKLASRGQGRACLAIGSPSRSILKSSRAKGFLFPNLVKLQEAASALAFLQKRRLAGVEVGFACIPIAMLGRKALSCGNARAGSNGASRPRQPCSASCVCAECQPGHPAAGILRGCKGQEADRLPDCRHEHTGRIASLVAALT